MEYKDLNPTVIHHFGEDFYILLKMFQKYFQKI